MFGTLEDDRTVPVLYKTKSLYGTKPNTNHKTNPNPNTNAIKLFYTFFDYRPTIFKLVQCSDNILLAQIKFSVHCSDACQLLACS